jgi:hypothetical protein
MFGIENEYPSQEMYETLEWPFFKVALGPNDFKVQLAFSQENNPRPLLYIKNEESIVGEDVLAFPPGNITYPVSFQVANYNGICASCLKFHYFKLPDPADEGPEKYLTQILGPIDMARLGDPAIKAFDFIFNTDVRFISGKYSLFSSEFGYVAECGVSFDDEIGGPDEEKVIFYGRNELSYAASGSNPDSGILGSSKDLSLSNDSFDQSFLKTIKVGFQMIEDAGNYIGVMLMADNNSSGQMIENLMLLGITKAELNITKALSGLKSNHHRFLKLANETNVAGTNCYRYELHVWGLDDTTEVFQEGTPSPPIYVYTKDGAVFCSKNFVSKIPFPEAYDRNYEELIGAEKIKNVTI